MEQHTCPQITMRTNKSKTRTLKFCSMTLNLMFLTALRIWDKTKVSYDYILIYMFFNRPNAQIKSILYVLKFGL